MSKFRSTILIIGLTIIAVAAALLTVLVLYATGTIVTDPIELVYTVHGDTKIYDGTPLTLEEGAYTLDSGEILEGHTAQVKIIGSQTDAGESEATLEVKIFDKKGFDVSDEYAVKVNAGTLTVEQRDLSVYIKDGQEVFYNGKEVFFNDYQIEGDTKLVKGHKIAGTNDSIINVGTLPLDVKPVIYDAFDNDVTENYNINFSAGEVKVVPRPLTLKPKSVSKVYDGTELTATEYEIVSGSFAPGQTPYYSIIFTGGKEAAQVDCTDESGRYIEFIKEEFEIRGEDGKSVDLDNYELTLEDALFTISPRPITILTATQTFTYDGEAHYNDTIQFLSGSLAPKQIISVSTVISVTDVQNEPVENKLTFAIEWEDGTEVNEENYAIMPIYGKLTVKKYKLTLYTKDYSKIYDGEPLSDLIDRDDTNYELKADLDSKFTVNTKYPDSFKTQKDVKSGTYSLQKVTVSLDGVDVTEKNFDIDVKAGKYAITKRPLTIRTASKSFTYDADEHDYTENYETAGLLTDDKFSITGSTKVIDVKDSGPNVFTYEIKRSGQDVTGNYEISHDWGTLTVLKRALTIQSDSKSFEYDGAEHDYHVVFKSIGLLSEKHEIKILDGTKVKNVEGNIPNLLECTVQEKNGGAKVLDNYEVTFIPGVLTVVQAEYTLTTLDDTKEYDGTPLEARLGTATGLVDGHSFSLIGNLPSITDAGTLKNEQFFDIIDEATGKIVTYNYKVKYDYGTLEVTPKPETISLNNAITIEYDGNVHGMDEFKAQAFVGTLPTGIAADDFNITELSEIKNADKHYFTAEYTGDNGNYVLTVSPGTVTVTRKTVNVTYGGTALSMTYGGQNTFYSDDAKVLEGLESDFGTLESAVLSKSLNNIKVSNAVISRNGEDITSNLNVTYEDITVTVNACAFTLVTPAYSNRFDFFIEDVVSGVSATGLAAGDRLVIKAADIMTDQDSYYKVVSYDIVGVVDGVEQSVLGYYRCTNPGAGNSVFISYSI